MYLTTAQVRAILGISRWTISRRIKAGELDAIKGSGRNGRVLIATESVTRYIERHTIPADTAAA